MIGRTNSFDRISASDWIEFDTDEIGFTRMAPKANVTEPVLEHTCRENDDLILINVSITAAAFGYAYARGNKMLPDVAALGTSM